MIKMIQMQRPLPLITGEEMEPIMATCKQRYSTYQEAYAKWWMDKIPPSSSLLAYCWEGRSFFKNLPGYPDGPHSENQDAARFNPLTKIPGLEIPRIQTQASIGGEPVILFHGSSNWFDEFDSNNNFFSTDPIVAQGFADVSGNLWGRPGFNPTLYAVVIESDNLIDGIAARLITDSKIRDPDICPAPDDNKARDAQLRGEGDCVVWRNTKDPLIPSDVYHIANPSKIKIVSRWRMVLKDDGEFSGTCNLTVDEMIHHGFFKGE